MSRLPLRLRLTLAFGLVMAAVLAATSVVVYGIFRSDLNKTIDNSLRARAAAANVESASGEDFAQRLSRDGSVLASSPNIGGRALVTPAQLARAGVCRACRDPRL